MDMKNEGRELIQTQDNENMGIENIAAKMLIASGNKKKMLAYFGARAERDKLVDSICKNMDDIKKVIDECDIDTQIAVLDICIEMLENIQRLQVVQFHVGFMTDSALDNTTDINMSIERVE